MKQTPHLTAALTSLICLLAALIGFTYYAQALEQKYISALAPLNLPQAMNGSAMQRAALNQPDLLVIYGSSEVTYVNTPFEADRFFRNYPTGFAVMDVAKLGASALVMAQDLAALGPDLRGKRIVISLSPGTFIQSGFQEKFYTGNYSRLHAYEMVFSPYLSPDLKRAAAQIMLEYTDTYSNDPLLQFALTALAGQSTQNHLRYYLVWPLGRLQIGIMQLQDHAEVIAYLRSHNLQPSVNHIPRVLDWTKVLETAQEHQKSITSNNPYGVEKWMWPNYQQILARDTGPRSHDLTFIQKVVNSHEWANLRILLNVLQQLGAQPLILSRPMNVHLWEAMGVSEKAQNSYYSELHKVVDPYQFPIVDFRSYGQDIYFSVDGYSHTSPEGWVYVDQVLDAYFHGGIH